MQKTHKIADGKAKTLYEVTNDPKKEFAIMEFRDDTSAFDGVKMDKLAGKGEINNKFNAFIMNKLAESGIATHFEHTIDDHNSLVRRLDMFPIECVVRNISTGSLCRRLGVEEGLTFDPAMFEFFLKNDELHDPMINESHILNFGWATQPEIDQMKFLTHEINFILKPLFLDVGILLVDYKLEFGKYGRVGEILLGDEFTPDGCRLWDVETRKSLDKDRYRKDEGDVVEAYQEVARRLGVI